MKSRKILLLLLVLTLLPIASCFAETATETYFHLVWHVLGTESETYYSWLNILDSTASSDLGSDPVITLNYSIGDHEICVIEFITTCPGTHTLTVSKTEFTDSDSNAVSYVLKVIDGTTEYSVSSSGSNTVSFPVTVSSSKANKVTAFHFPVELNLTASILGQMTTGTAYYSDVTVGVAGP